MLDYNNLELIDDSINNITLVGEIHQDEEYQNIVTSVIENKNPNIIAVESSTIHPFYFSGGIAQSKHYGSDLECKVVRLDQDEEWMDSKLGSDRMSAVYYGNQLKHLVKDLGDINPRIVSEARNNVRDNLGEYPYRILFTVREILMSRRLKYINNKFPNQNIVGIFGAFHIYAISKIYDLVDPLSCDNRIVKNPSIHNKWHIIESIDKVS